MRDLAGGGDGLHVADGSRGTGEDLRELLQSSHRTEPSNLLRLRGCVSPATAELRCGETDRIVRSDTGRGELIHRDASSE